MSKKSGPSYDSYLRQYYQKQNQLAKKGLQMRDSVMSEKEFKFAYNLMKRDYQELINQGKRKALGNITRDLVSNQAYEFTREQYYKYIKAFKKLGFKFSQEQIRANQGIREAFVSLQNEYSVLKESGLTGKEAGLVLAQEYFGS